RVLSYYTRLLAAPWKAPPPATEHPVIPVSVRISVIESNGQTHALLTPLTQVQIHLLELWGLPPDLYETIARGFPVPPVKMSEPSEHGLEIWRTASRPRRLSAEVSTDHETRRDEPVWNGGHLLE